MGTFAAGAAVDVDATARQVGSWARTLVRSNPSDRANPVVHTFLMVPSSLTPVGLASW
jgi:hypothetical protein